MESERDEFEKWWADTGQFMDGDATDKSKAYSTWCARAALSPSSPAAPALASPGATPTPAEAVPECLRPLSPEEAARYVPISGAKIDRALKEGAAEADAMRRGGVVPPLPRGERAEPVAWGVLYTHHMDSLPDIDVWDSIYHSEEEATDRVNHRRNDKDNGVLNPRVVPLYAHPAPRAARLRACATALCDALDALSAHDVTQVGAWNVIDQARALRRALAPTEDAARPASEDKGPDEPALLALIYALRDTGSVTVGPGIGVERRESNGETRWCVYKDGSLMSRYPTMKDAVLDAIRITPPDTLRSAAATTSVEKP